VKRIALLFSFLFIAFLSTPTLVKLIEKKADVSQFYNFSEEEDDVLSFTVFSNDVKVSFLPIFHVPSSEKQLILLDGFMMRHDNLAEEIFLPPPEQIGYNF
jgi:hypothetical protein